MSKEEILNQIDKLESQIFFLDMKDNWTVNDHGRSSHWHNQVLELKKQFKDEYGEEEYDLYFKGVCK